MTFDENGKPISVGSVVVVTQTGETGKVIRIKPGGVCVVEVPSMSGHGTVANPWYDEDLRVKALPTAEARVKSLREKYATASVLHRLHQFVMSAAGGETLDIDGVQVRYNARRENIDINGKPYSGSLSQAAAEIERLLGIR